MNENKQYFVIPRDGGELRISFDAVAMLARGACAEVSGVTGVSAADGAGDRSAQRGVVVERGEAADDCIVKLYITVLYGQVITETAAAVQENVRNAVESCLALHVQAVDVFISGITFPRQ